jgi:hypothetical protein
MSREGCKGPSGLVPESIFRFVFLALFARNSSRQTPEAGPEWNFSRLMQTRMGGARNQRSADSFVRAKAPMRRKQADKAVRAPEKSSRRTMIPRDCSAKEPAMPSESVRLGVWREKWISWQWGQE